jgi:hypothetical protein
MDGYPRGEPIARVVVGLHVGIGMAQKPYEGRPVLLYGFVRAVGRAGRVPIETLRCRVAGLSAIVATESTREESRRKRGLRCSVGNPGKGEAQGSIQPGSPLTTARSARDSRKGQSPEVGAGRSGLPAFGGVRCNGRLNGTRVHREA